MLEPMPRTRPRSRGRAAAGCADVLDSALFRALCEPIRIEIVRLLIAQGRSNLGDIASRLPQDTSVISRHLALLHRAGVVRRQKVGRHVHFELDGPALVARIERILEQLRRAVPYCCPADSRPSATGG
jgi:DNA-binding transcriptional ArsR family regulator